MADGTKTVLTWTLRLIGVGLLVWVLATQVQWHDEIVLASGQSRVGVVVLRSDGVYAFTPRDEVADDPLGSSLRPYTVADLATRPYGSTEVPDVRYGARTLIARLGDRVPTVVLVLLGLTALVMLTAFRWMLLLRGVGIRMPLLRCQRLTFIGGFFNLAVPGATGGDIVKAWYASKEARSRYGARKGMGTKAVLSVFVDRFVGLFGLVLFAAGVLLLAARGEAYEVPRLVVLGVLAAGGGGAVLVLSRPVRRALGLSWLMRRLPFQGVMGELRSAAGLYRDHGGAVGAAMAISLFNHATNATACYFLATALGIEGISLGAAMALVPLANLLSAIPLLPGGWGVGELAFAYFFGQIGIPATEAVGLSVVFRLAVLGVNLPGGLLWIFWRGHPTTETIAADVEAAAARGLPQEESNP